MTMTLVVKPPPQKKSHQNWNVPTTEISQYLKSHQNCYMSLKLKSLKKTGNVKKTDTLSKLKYYPKWNVTKIDMSPKLKCHQSWNVTKTEVSPKWIVTKTEVSSKLKCYQTL